MIIDYSRIACLKRSKKEFIRRYVLKEPCYVSPEMELGTFLHDLLKEVALKNFTITQVIQKITFYHPEILPKLEVINSIVEYISKCNVHSAEEELYETKNDLVFKARLDLVLEDNGRKHLIDFKFTKQEKYKPDPLQLKFYNLVWKMKTKKEFSNASFLVCNFGTNSWYFESIDLSSAIEDALKEVKWFILKTRNLAIPGN